MRFFKNLCLMVMVGCISSCEKNIVITPPPYTPRVSIQSMLEPDSVPVVYFSRTVPYFSDSIQFANLVIRQAQIIIASNIGKDSLVLDSVFEPIYCQFKYYYKGRVKVQGDKTYTLNIINGSESYTATCITNQSKINIDSIGYTYDFTDVYGGHEGVITYFQDIPGEVDFYRFEMFRYIDSTDQFAGPKIIASCLGVDSILIDETGRSVYKDEGQQGIQMKIVSEPAYTHSEGTEGIVYIQSIDKNAYDFFDQLDKQKLAQSNPFVEPVFLKDGQFGNRAVGYFSAMKKSNPALFVFPE